MSIPHMGGSRKRKSFEFHRGSCERAAKVIFGMRMPARKPRAAAAQDICDLRSGCAMPKQFFSDPFIGDAPIGVREAIEDLQPVQTIGVDPGSSRGAYDCDVGVRCCRKVWRQLQVRWASSTVLSLLQQSGAARRQASCAAAVSDW